MEGGMTMESTRTFSAAQLFASLLFSIMAAQALAQSHPEYIPLGGGVKAVLYRPDSNPSPHVGVIIIHRTANYLQHQGCTDRKSTRLNSSHSQISYAVFCLKKKKKTRIKSRMELRTSGQIGPRWNRRPRAYTLLRL